MDFASTPRYGSQPTNDDIDIDFDPVPIFVKCESLEELADDDEDGEKVLVRVGRKDLVLVPESPISSGPMVLVHKGPGAGEQNGSKVEETDPSPSVAVHPGEVYEYKNFEFSNNDDVEELLEDPLEFKKEDISRISTSAKDSSKPKPRPFKCSYPKCSKTYTRAGTLKFHERVHTGERPFKCPFSGCSATYNQAGNLAYHESTHTGERPFMCPFPGCSKAYTNAGSLKSHEIIHAEGNPFKCPFPGCSKAFTKAGNLRSHTLTHGGEKPFKCAFPGCSQAFIKRASLKVHVRIHTGEKPFKCTFPGCSKAFSQGATLKVHEVVMHQRKGSKNK